MDTEAFIRWALDDTRTVEDRYTVELLVENGDAFKSCRLDYRDGERYPHLERDANRPDLLAEIIQARAK